MQRHRVAFDGQMRLGTSSHFVSVSRYSLCRIEYRRASSRSKRGRRSAVIPSGHRWVKVDMG